MKLMLAYIVLTYDVRIEGTGRPKNIEIKGAAFPDPGARLLVRLRRR